MISDDRSPNGTTDAAELRYSDAWSAPIDRAPLAFFDVEMTGLDPVTDRIVEIAIIRVEAGQRVEAFDSLVRPDAPMRPEAFAVHGIDADTLTSAPEFDIIAPKVRALFDGAVAVGHGTELDVLFLDRAFRAAHLEPPDLGDRIDTLTRARRAIAAKSHSLEALAVALALPARRRHRAIDDAETVIDLFARLVHEFGATTPRDLAQVRVGQRSAVAVREQIARALEDLQTSGAPCTLTFRTRGRAPTSLRARIERWTPPHARIVIEPGNLVRVIRADRVLRIEPVQR